MSVLKISWETRRRIGGKHLAFRRNLGHFGELHLVPYARSVPAIAYHMRRLTVLCTPYASTEHRIVYV
eukprot:3371244-Rhodomonas_salina.1